MEAMNDLQFWGKAVLVLIPVQIVLTIVSQILFHIFYVAITREKIPSKTDERDKLIQLKATRNSYFAFSGGFLLAMTALALGHPPFVMFVILISGGLVSGIVEGCTQLYFYRRGF